MYRKEAILPFMSYCCGHCLCCFITGWDVCFIYKIYRTSSLHHLKKNN